MAHRSQPWTPPLHPSLCCCCALSSRLWPALLMAAGPASYLSCLGLQSSPWSQWETCGLHPGYPAVSVPAEHQRAPADYLPLWKASDSHAQPLRYLESASAVLLAKGPSEHNWLRRAGSRASCCSLAVTDHRTKPAFIAGGPCSLVPQPCSVAHASCSLYPFSPGQV